MPSFERTAYFTLAHDWVGSEDVAHTRGWSILWLARSRLFVAKERIGSFDDRIRAEPFDAMELDLTFDGPTSRPMVKWTNVRNVRPSP